MKRFTVAVLLAVALLASACGGGGGDDSADDAASSDTTEAPAEDDEADEAGDDDGESAASADDCPVDPDDVADAFPDVDFKEPVSDSEDTCTYLNSDETGAVHVAVVAEGEGGYKQMKAAFGSQAENIDDIGDEAIWIEGNTSLHALEGDTYVVVQLASLITDFSDGEEAVFEKLRSGAIEVAKAAVDNL